MLELLAAIQGIDPFVAMLWSLFIFAAGMYPVGIMLGSQCSPCCSPCPCPQGTLPDTLTVTFKGLPDKTQGADLCTLSFTSCFGDGAVGKITAPGGTAGVDDGPITGVSLTATGSGYAKYGRTAPTVTATGSGTGAQFSITLSKSQDACSVDYWQVSAISVTKGGTEYDDGESLTFTVADGDTEETPASATVSTTRAAPTLSVTAQPGSGGVFAVSVSPVGTTPQTWTIESISVTSGGSGYVDNTLMTVSLGANDVEVYPASVYVRTGRVEPTIALDISSASGIGATFSPVLTKATGFDGRDVWNITGITITNAGLDYAVYDLITLAVNDGQATPYSYFYAYVSEVGENGEVVAVQLDYGGEFFKDGGVAEEVDVSYGGSYYNDDGVITKVTLGSGGVYYREDKSGTPYVAPVTVTINQKYPSNGTDGEIAATVASDPTKATFGQIASLTIAKAGDDYLAWEWKNTKCCGWYWDDKPVVVRREFPAQPDLCELTFKSCFGSGARGTVTAPGDQYGESPGPIESVAVTSGGSGYARLGRTEPVVTASTSGGTGAVLSVTLKATTDACDLDYWYVEKVNITSPGFGYTSGTKVTFGVDLGLGDLSDAAASGTLEISTSVPTLTATAPGGSGASLGVTVATRGTTPETWTIAGITVEKGGTKYTDNAAVTITRGKLDQQLTAAAAVIRTTRLEPILTASPQGVGGGAELIPVLTAPFPDVDGRTVWGIADFTINNAGTGYQTNQFINISSTSGVNFGLRNNYFGRIAGVDPDGKITATQVIRQGLFAQDGGVIELVTVSNPGAYYQDNGISAVNLTSTGYYYREDASLTPYVSPVTVGFEDSCPGTGAVITAIVNSDTKDPLFGTNQSLFGSITGLTISTPGIGYIAGVVATPGITPSSTDNARACRYSHRMCGGWENFGKPGYVSALYQGPTTPPSVELRTEWDFTGSSDTPFASICDTIFTADKAPAKCDDWSDLLFTSKDGATATVTTGGIYDQDYKRAATFCDECCQGEEPPPEEVTVTLEHNRYGDTSLSGDYVLTRGAGLGWSYQSADPPLGIIINIQPGRCDDASVAACDNCIKKCEATARVIVTGGEDTDMRNCSSYEPGLSPEEQSIALCESFCTEDTPTCNPSGLVFSFFDPGGSEPNYEAPKNPCDENTDLVNYPNHLNTFTLTVQ